MANERKSYNIPYVAATYALFWGMLLSSGIIMRLPLNKWITALFIILGSWTPTMTFLIMFRRIFPGITVKEFYRRSFAKHINWLFVLTVTMIMTAIFAACVCIAALQKGAAVSELLNFSAPAIIFGLITSVLQGATGEESGWRGYLLPFVEKKAGVIKGSFIVGIIWTFWHTPLWFLTSGYKGQNLLIYIISFVIGIVSFAIIIGICYHHCNNLFIPIWMHFLFNFLTTFYTGKMINYIVYLAAFYTAAALGFIVWHRVTVNKIH